jgi:hypothetical protein
LYECGTWSLTSKEYYRVFENRVLKGVFVLMRGEATGGWRELHYEDLTILYPSPNIVRVRCLGHGSCMGEKRNACKIFVRKSQVEIVGSSRHRQDDNIRVRDSHESFAPMLC